MTLTELSARLRAFADGELSFEALRASFLPAFAADPLDVSESASEPWDEAPDDTRLYWRLLHLFDSADATMEPALRRLAGRSMRALASAGSATTLELLGMIDDQDRFCAILRKHAAGIISRTGLLSVITESGYPAHVKLWLQHAGDAALAQLFERMEAGEYAAVAGMVERAP